MGQPARRPGTRRGPEPQPPRLRPARGVEDHSVDLARQIAEKIGKLPDSTDEVEVRVRKKKKRPAHDMLGSEGYALVSRYFMRRVLPYCLNHHIISTLQGSVLSNLIGRSDRGLARATQQEIADEIGVTRGSIGGAVDRLCYLNLVRKVQRCYYELNPRVAFRGNGDEQLAFLESLRALKLASKFPDELAPELTLFSAADVADTP